MSLTDLSIYTEHNPVLIIGQRVTSLTRGCQPTHRSLLEHPTPSARPRRPAEWGPCCRPGAAVPLNGKRQNKGWTIGI